MKQSSLHTFFGSSQGSQQKPQDTDKKPLQTKIEEEVTPARLVEGNLDYLKSSHPVTDYFSNNTQFDKTRGRVKLEQGTGKSTRQKIIMSDDDESYNGGSFKSDDEEEYSGSQKKNRGKSVKASAKSTNKVPASRNTTGMKSSDIDVLPSQGEGAPISKFDKEGNINYDAFEDKTPYWAREETRLDAQKRPPSDPNFDSTTLYIPPAELNKLTPAKRQFWLIKAQNMDKIIFFKLGKFYELFDMDAVIGVQQLGLAFMGNTMHAGVPEVALDKFADRLVQLGYSVAIVEQTETERERKSRMANSSNKAKEKVIQRDLVKVFTKGTYLSPLDDAAKLDSNYLWIFRCHGLGYSFCIAELSLNKCWLGYYSEDAHLSHLKMLLYQMRPSEIVIDQNCITRDILKIFEHLSSNPVITKVSNRVQNYCWNSLMLTEKYAGERFIKNLDTISAEFYGEEVKSAIRGTFSGMITYLEELKILDEIGNALELSRYDSGTMDLQRMILDAQTLEQLEILEASHDFRTKRADSLLHTIDRCASLPGKRHLKNLVCSPFLDSKVINERLDAIQDLNRHRTFIREFQNHLEKIGDLERTLARLFKYGIKQKSRVVLFEDVSTTRLRELKSVFSHLVKLHEVLLGSAQTCQWQSNLMKRLTSTEEEEGLLKSSLKDDIRDIEMNIVWTGDNMQIPVPKQGINPKYDNTKLKIHEIIKELDKYLIQQQQDLGCRQIEYAHAKTRFELSIPENLKVPAHYQFSSCKKGFKRYSTPVTLKLVDKMEGIEEELKEQMKEFSLYIFEYFASKRLLWENLVNIVREMDVLCSMSRYSFQSRGQFCRPEFFPESEGPFIEFIESRHPVLSSQQEEFIPNDIKLGFRTKDNVALLTGPNMGGKSTVLRQACLIAIIAQLGCYVPAIRAELTPIDRIFTRLGANDKLVEGKSTFFVEMEDVHNLVTWGTNRSLAIMDELGRGTSTADGFAIAASIIHHIAKNIKCLAVFSTHYHMLTHFCLDYTEVSYWKMDYVLQDQDISFLYKLVEGVCNRSFGIKIGRLAGLPDHMLIRAEEISRQVDSRLNRSFREDIDRQFSIIEDALRTGKDITNLNLDSSHF